MNFKEILKSAGKNLLSFILGAIPCTVISVWYGLHVWAPARVDEQATIAGKLFGSLAYILFAVIGFGIIGIICGGILGMLIYNVAVSLRKKKDGQVQARSVPNRGN